MITTIWNEKQYDGTTKVRFGIEKYILENDMHKKLKRDYMKSVAMHSLKVALPVFLLEAGLITYVKSHSTPITKQYAGLEYKIEQIDKTPIENLSFEEFNELQELKKEKNELYSNNKEMIDANNTAHGIVDIVHPAVLISAVFPLFLGISGCEDKYRENLKTHAKGIQNEKFK